MISQLKDLARGRWPQLLRAAGVPEQLLNKRHQECPFCGGVDRFRFTDWREEGRYICSGCGNGSGVDLLMRYRHWNFSQLRHEAPLLLGVRMMPDKAPAKPDPRVRLRKLQRELLPLDGQDPASRYLRHRGLENPPKMLKYHPALTYFVQGEALGDYPALVALVSNARGEPVTYHVTYLNPEGGKLAVDAPRKTLPPIGPTAGCAIRLFALTGAQLVVTEGIETALAFHAARGACVWSLRDTSGMKSFEPPPGVKRVMIVADNDRHFAGQAAAYTLAQRLVMLHKLEHVEVCVQGEPGQDFLDYYQACGAGAQKGG